MRNSIVASHIFIKYRLVESGVTAEMIQNKLDDISEMFKFSDMDLYIIEEAAEETSKTIIDSITDKSILKAAAPVDEYAEEIKRFKSRKNFVEISADNTAVNEIVYHFGTFAEAQRKARKLKINLIKSGYSVLPSSLDNLYCGFMEEFPALFKPCDNSSDQYIKLLSLADYEQPAVKKMSESPFYNDLITDLKNYILDNCEKWTAEENPTAEKDTAPALPAVVVKTLNLCAACGTPAKFCGGNISYQTITANFKLLNMADFRRLPTTEKAIKNATGGQTTTPSESSADFAIIYKKEETTKYFYKFERSGESLNNLKPCNIFFGYDVKTNKPIVKNITETKSIFIGGTAGGGKSSLMNSIISSLVMAGGCTFDFIDLKQVEFSIYNRLSANICKYKVAITKQEAVAKLRRIKSEILQRYEEMKRAGIRKADIKDYPPHVLFIDEYATLEAVEGSEIESLISFIAATGRACNYYIVAATQHATNQTFTTKARANFQSRIALKCMTVQQSNNIIGTRDAVDLCGAGDALAHFDGCADFERFQAPLFDDTTAEKIGLTERKQNAFGDKIGGF